LGFAFRVVAPHTRLSVIAAEDGASEVLSPVVATETAAATGLRGGVVFFDSGRGGRTLVVAALNRMAFRAAHVFDMLGVRELGAIGAAFQHGVERFGLSRKPLCVADHAIIFYLRFVVEAARRMADVTFGVRADFDGQSFLGRFVAVSALQLFAVSQFVSDVKFVLLGVEKRVEIVALRKVALRRTRDQTLVSVVTDDASLLRLGRELYDVTVDAGFVSREFQTQFYVAVRRLDDTRRDLPDARAFVT